jgi:chromosome segregation ATPase
VEACRVQIETLRRDFQEASKRLEMLKEEKAKIESEAIMYQNLAAKTEGDLRSLSDAYNSLEQSNLHLENELKALRGGEHSTFPDVEAIKAEAREEALKESEGELNDLLVCLGQEQSKVDKLSARLLELGEDVDKLLEGIGDDAGAAEDFEDEEDAE